MATSIFLAKVIGLFGAVSTLAILARYKKYLEMETALAKNQTAIALSGFIILVIGSLLVVSHQVWSADWRVIITIIGWLVFIKGALRVFFPETVAKLISRKKDNRWFILAEIVFLLVSLYLFYKGFFLI